MSDSELQEEEFTGKVNPRTILRILGLTRKHWPFLLGFLVFVTAISVLESSNTYLSKMIIDDAVIPGNRALLAKYLGWYAGLTVAFAAFIFLFVYFAGRLGEQILYDLRKSLFGHLQSLPFSYFDKTPVGWIMSRVNSDTTRIADFATWNVLDLTWGTVNITTALFFMFSINRGLATIVMLIIPVLIFVAIKFQKRIIAEYRKVRSINSRITGNYNENITGVRVVKALVKEKANLERFSSLTGQMYTASYRAAWLSAIFLPIVQILTSLALGAVCWYGGYQAADGAISVGGIKAFISYILFMMWPIQDLARVYAEMQQSVAGAERVFSLLDTEPEIRNQSGSRAVTSLRGTLRFDHVDFRYVADKSVLEDFCLDVRPGEMIALVGPTGGGKSTLANLVCRFYEPTGGKLLLDGEDYRNYTLESWQSRIGVVLQTPHLFSGTILENIRYGRLGAGDAEVHEAARLAHAEEFILELEKGWDEQVGEGGVLLSVGQKQLISIARAILAKPDLIIMDEATSSIDTIAESLIQKGMERLLSGSTSFIIAHRLSTIKHADRILVIKDGRIEESGTHHELLARKGHYHKLYTYQFRQEIDQPWIGTQQVSGQLPR